MSRAATAVAAAAAITVLASGCQTTQQLSARIARKLSHQSAKTTVTALGAANRDVRVLRAVLVGSGGQSAVAVQLTNTSARAQVDFPILIDVRDAKGVSVYRNDTKGIEPSIQQLALLPPHTTAWWVDNEVLGNAGVPTSVTAAVGAPTGTASGAPAAITTSGVSADNSFPGPHVSLTVHNSSAVAQTQLPVYAVSLRGNQVDGAGRGIVPMLAAGASAQVLVVMTGSVSGRTIALTVSPTATR
jgi:hypothetical protein